MGLVSSNDADLIQAAQIVLRLRDGRMADMQDHPNRQAALKAAGAPG